MNYSNLFRLITTKTLQESPITIQFPSAKLPTFSQQPHDFAPNTNIFPQKSALHHLMNARMILRNWWHKLPSIWRRRRCLPLVHLDVEHCSQQDIKTWRRNIYFQFLFRNKKKLLCNVFCSRRVGNFYFQLRQLFLVLKSLRSFWFNKKEARVRLQQRWMFFNQQLKHVWESKNMFHCNITKSSLRNFSFSLSFAQRKKYLLHFYRLLSCWRFKSTWSLKFPALLVLVLITFWLASITRCIIVQSSDMKSSFRKVKELLQLN